MHSRRSRRSRPGTPPSLAAVVDVDQEEEGGAAPEVDDDRFQAVGSKMSRAGHSGSERSRESGPMGILGAREGGRELGTGSRRCQPVTFSFFRCRRIDVVRVLQPASNQSGTSLGETPRFSKVLEGSRRFSRFSRFATFCFPSSARFELVSICRHCDGNALQWRRCRFTRSDRCKLCHESLVSSWLIGLFLFGIVAGPDRRPLTTRSGVGG